MISDLIRVCYFYFKFLKDFIQPYHYKAFLFFLRISIFIVKSAYLFIVQILQSRVLRLEKYFKIYKYKYKYKYI